MIRITTASLRGSFDDATIQRGQAYAAGGHVLTTSVGSGSGRTVVMGEVQGGAARPYVASVSIGGDGQILHARCTCPITYDCKHAVAVVLVGQGEVEASRPAWSRDLDGFLNDLEQRPRSGSGTDHVPLGLLVDYKALESRWSNATCSLLIRPMKRGKRDNWIKAGVAWHDVQGSLRYVAEHDPAQVEVLLDLATLFLRGYGQQNPNLLSLGPMVWPLLRRVRDVGIELIPGAGLSAVHVDDTPVQISADITEASGSVALRVGLAYDGSWWPGEVGEVATVGEPAHGVALLKRVPGARTYLGPDRELTLVPLTNPLPLPVQRRLATNSSLVVPAAERERFELEYLPRLQRQVRTESSDGSVEFPQATAPQLVCTVEWAREAKAVTSWSWRYRYGAQVRSYDLGAAEDVALVRDADAERALLAEVVLPEAVRSGGGHHPVLSRQEWTDRDLMTFVDEVLPALRVAAESGAFVLVETGLQRDFRPASEAPDVSFTATGGPDARDWLDLAVAITIDGESVPLGSVLTALTTGQQLIFTESGRHVAATHPAFSQLADLVADAAQIMDQPADGLRVGHSDLALWAELEALGVVEGQAREWARMALALRDFDGLPEVEVAGLASHPRPYQTEGIRWLSFLQQSGLGGILADDMGLGKTLQTLAMIAHARERGAAPFLVVAPTSVIGTWVSETARHVPGLVAHAVTSSAKRREETLAEVYAGADIVVTSYTLFRLEAVAYRDLAWGGLILDEAHTVKNHQSKTYQEVRRLDVPFRLALTGTPFENRLMELWSLLSIVAPGLYPSPKRFHELVVRPVEQVGDERALAGFRRRIRPFLLRRTKDLVAADLPPKQEQVLEIELSPRHRRIYDTHLQRERQTVLGLVDDFDRNRIAIFGALTRLRQLSLDPALVDPDHEGVGSAKLDALVEQLHELAAEGHRALVFSQFTSYLKRVQARLNREGIDTVYLDGRTRNRPAVIDSFKTGSQPAFLISLKAGGSGLTLTEADYVFVLDPWWNPAVEAQAIDRVHRIGQQQHVMAYRLVSKDTIEEKVMALKERKAALFTQVLDGDGSMATAIGAEDVRALFEA